MKKDKVTRLLMAASVLFGLHFSESSVHSLAQPIIQARTETLAPRQNLPGDKYCAGRVVPSGPETRPANEVPNHTRGHQKNLSGSFLSQVTGDFTGTTDEIIQWAACKWGIDTDVVRAQAAQESSWFMSAAGDFTDDPNRCAPGHVPGGDGRPGCPESVGIMQVKYRYHEGAHPEAGQSTAYNLDYALATWRTCYEGQEPWLADHPSGSGYRAGDLWGCVGRWYAGDWRSDLASGYVSRVQANLAERIWTQDWFLNLAAPPAVG